MKKKLVIATRGSALALWQANHVRDALIGREPQLEIELLTIKTKGDKILDVPLAKVGGKGLFVKEIEEALLDGRADIAVHSMKDVPSVLAPGLYIAATSKRADPRDALCSRAGTLAGLPRGARVGTSSLRRACQLLAIRPDLKIEPLRGNVPTRLSKLDAGNYDAIVLAAAGLDRLEHGDRATEKLDVDSFVPAVGQGALGLEVREDDSETAARVVAAIHDHTDAARVAAERAFLARLEGGCQAPIAGHAVMRDGELHMTGLVGRPDGSEVFRTEKSGPTESAASLGDDCAAELLRAGAGAVIEELVREAGN